MYGLKGILLRFILKILFRTATEMIAFHMRVGNDSRL